MTGPDGLQTAEALLTQGDDLRRQGKDAEAEPLYLRAISIFEKTTGNMGVQVGEGLLRLAGLNRFLNLDAEAVPLYQRALAIFEAALGADHPRVADVLLGLGDLHLDNDDDGRGHIAAEPHYRRALDILERHLGTDRPLADARPDLLAVLRDLQGRVSDAESLHRWAMTVLTQELGPDHLRVAAQTLRLGRFLGSRGRFDEAERFLRQALNIAENALGPEHPGVRTYLRNLAGWCGGRALWGFGDQMNARTDVPREAEALYQRALAITEKSFGKDHPAVVNDLAALEERYRFQHRDIEAKILRRRILAIIDREGPRRRLWAVDWLLRLRGFPPLAPSADADVLLHRALAVAEGGFVPDDPSQADTLFRFAHLCLDEGRYAEAEALFARTRTLTESAFGAGHPRVACALFRIALHYFAKGTAEAQRYYDDALAILTRVPVIDDSRTAEDLLSFVPELQILPALGYAARSVGRLMEARLPVTAGVNPPAGPDVEPLLQVLLPAFEKGLGPDHPLVGGCLIELGDLRVMQGSEAGAEQLFLRALAIGEKAPGNGRDIEVASLSGLAILYHVQKRYAEAEPLYRRWLARSEQRPDPQEVSLFTPLFNLARCCADQGRWHEVEPLFQRALAIAQARRTDFGWDVDDRYLRSFYRLLGRDADMEALARQDLSWAERISGPDHPLYGLPRIDLEPRLRDLAEICRRQGNFLEAERLYRRALAGCEEDLGPDGGTRLAPLLTGLGRVYFDQGAYADAHPLFARAINILENVHKRNPEENRWFLSALEAYVCLLRKMDRNVEAQEVESRVAPVKVEVESERVRQDRQVVRQRGSLPLDWD